MGNLKKREREAIEAVARRFSATREEGSDRSGAYIVIEGKRVALEIAAVKVRDGNHSGRAKLRLRFDKVVVWLIEHSQAALRDVVPDGLTVLLTVTAPIRVPGKTAVALEDRVRALLERKPERAEEKGTIHGNQIRIRLLQGDAAAKVIGFVHNPDTDPRVLLDMTRSLLELFCARADTGAPKKPAVDRWLVVMNDGESSHIDAYRYICSRLRMPANFKKILMAFADGRVETLK